jgi:DNA-binding winged helix-turn-helix (wHTH) protein
MERRNLRRKPRQIATRRSPSRWAETKANTYPLRADANLPSPGTADAALEFGRFRVLLRRRQLLADGVPVELGTRAFDLLLILLQADGSLVSKEALLSRVWPGIVVSEENLKVQVSALRKALGADRDVIRTEFGRGYRFTGVLCTNTVTDPRHLTARPSGGEAGMGPQECRQSLRGAFPLDLAADRTRSNAPCHLAFCKNK